jgi:predicted NAD/FAD-binding protein
VLRTRHRYGVKIYTHDWHTWFGMTPEAVADWLLDHGFSFAFVANQITPLPALAVATRHRSGSPPIDDLDHVLRDAL